MQEYEELIKWICGGGAFGAVFKIIELRGKNKVDAVNGFEKLVVALQKEREESQKELEQIKEERNELREWQKVINQMLQDAKKMKDEQSRKS